MNPVGKKHDQPFHFSFNASLKVGFRGSRVTFDAERLRVTEKLKKDLSKESLAGIERGRVIRQYWGRDVAPGNAEAFAEAARLAGGRRRAAQ
jgi:hypothetical protein